VAYLGLLVSASVGGVAYTIAFGELWIGLNLAAFVLAYGLYQYYWAVYYGLGLVSSYLRSEIRTDLLVVLVAPAVILARPLLILPFYLGYATFVVRAERDISQVLGRRSSRTTRARAGVDREDHELWRYALISAIGTAASMASLQLGVVISHQALGATLAGSYAAAYALILPLLYLPRTLSTALLPRAAAEVARGGHAAIRKQLGSLTDLLALVALPLCLAGIVLAHPILDLVSGSGYSDGVAPLRILLVAAFFLMVSVPAVNVLSAGTVSSLATPFYASVAGLLVCCAVWAAWLPRGGGLVAVAAGVLAGSVTKSVPPIAIAFRRYRVSGSFVGVTTLALIAGGAFGAQGGGMLAGAAVIGAGASVASVCFLTRLWNAKSDTP
jgi:O-antigen/teichoic acid export membrane protein